MPRVQQVKKTQPVRSTRQFLESEEQPIGTPKIRAMRSRGPARQSLESAIIDPVENPVSKEKLDMLAFMEEPITVMVHDTTDPTAVPVPPVWNDGRSQYFIRGMEQTVKRKFVEVLARAKRTTYTQEKYKDGNGDDAYRQIPHVALLYPFSVVVDDNPRGKDWLKSVLASG